MGKSSGIGFTKGKSCLTNFTNFNDELADVVDESRTLNVVCLGFSKDFDTVSHKIPIGTAQLTQRDGGVSNTGYIPEPSEHNPGQPALGDPACMHREVGQHDLQRPFLP